MTTQLTFQEKILEQICDKNKEIVEWEKKKSANFIEFSIEKLGGSIIIAIQTQVFR